MTHIPYYTEETSELEALRNFVKSITSDNLELSLEKAQYQQRQWYSRAKEIQNKYWLSKR